MSSSPLPALVGIVAYLVLLEVAGAVVPGPFWVAGIVAILPIWAVGVWRLRAAGRRDAQD